MYSALQEALDMLPARPTCFEKPKLLFFRRPSAESGESC